MQSYLATRAGIQEESPVWAKCACRSMGVIGGAKGLAQGQGVSTGSSRLEGECKNGAC